MPNKPIKTPTKGRRELPAWLEAWAADIARGTESNPHFESISHIGAQETLRALVTNQDSQKALGHFIGGHEQTEDFRNRMFDFLSGVCFAHWAAFTRKPVSNRERRRLLLAAARNARGTAACLERAAVLHGGSDSIVDLIQDGFRGQEIGPRRVLLAGLRKGRGARLPSLLKQYALILEEQAQLLPRATRQVAGQKAQANLVIDKVITTARSCFSEYRQGLPATMIAAVLSVALKRDIGESRIRYRASQIPA